MKFVEKNTGISSDGFIFIDYCTLKRKVSDIMEYEVLAK